MPGGGADKAAAAAIVDADKVAAASGSNIMSAMQPHPAAGTIAIAIYPAAVPPGLGSLRRSLDGLR